MTHCRRRRRDRAKERERERNSTHAGALLRSSLDDAEPTTPTVLAFPSDCPELRGYIPETLPNRMPGNAATIGFRTGAARYLTCKWNFQQQCEFFFFFFHRLPVTRTGPTAIGQMTCAMTVDNRVCALVTSAIRDFNLSRIMINCDIRVVKTVLPYSAEDQYFRTWK